MRTSLLWLAKYHPLLCCSAALGRRRTRTYTPRICLISVSQPSHRRTHSEQRINPFRGTIRARALSRSAHPYGTHRHTLSVFVCARYPKTMVFVRTKCVYESEAEPHLCRARHTLRHNMLEIELGLRQHFPASAPAGACVYRRRCRVCSCMQIRKVHHRRDWGHITCCSFVVVVHGHHALGRVRTRLRHQRMQIFAQSALRCWARFWRKKSVQNVSAHARFVWSRVFLRRAQGSVL